MGVVRAADKKVVVVSGEWCSGSGSGSSSTTASQYYILYDSTDS